MTTLKITWSFDDDAFFRDAYERATGEAIQDDPVIENGFYSVMTTRATPDMVDTLPCTYTEVVP